MKTHTTLSLVSLVVATVFAPALKAQVSTPMRERIEASYIIAFGREPSSGEIAYWARQNPSSVAALVANHRNYLSRDAGTHRATIIRAYDDALGRNPTPGEIAYWFRGNDTYEQLMHNHIAWLGGNPGQYDLVIRRSYMHVFHRQPSSGELAYWKRQGVLSYVMLVACHEDWERRNGGRMRMGGALVMSPNTPGLVTVQLAPQIANEARAAAGVIPAGGGNVIAAGGGNVIAAGGGNVIAAGGGNVITAGGGN